MAMQDRNKHRPRSLRERSSLSPLERRERKQMALEDLRSNRQRKKLRLHLQLRRPSKKLSKASPLLVLKRLLVRWGHMLKTEERLLDKERRRVARQRKAQRNARMKKDREERKQAQAQIRKRLQEQRLSREALRKRMRSDLTMDDMLGDTDGQRRKTAIFCGC